MANEAQQSKILAGIKARGWFTAEVYQAAAQQLRHAGLIKLAERFSTGGNRKPVWVAA